MPASNMMSIAPSPSPARHFPVIRVFVSSTFSDLVAERNALAENVWPELERYCRQRGFTFQAIDLRWGVPSEAGLDHRTMQICFEELHRAQETSPEPNFLILLGDKYGWRPLPEMISEVEYARLFEHALSPEEQDTLAAWYRRDGNARPPHHVLRARTDSPDGQDYTRAPDADGRLCDTATWLAVQETLWAIVNRAYPGSLLPQRFAQGTDEMAASVRFQGSATEQEIWHGALRVEDARKHVVAWFRDIDRTDGDPEPSQLKRFMDLRPDQSPDEEAAAAIAELKTQVEEKLAPEPFLHARCRWETDSSGAFTGELTTDHLAPMCETILTRLRALILRQINDYWGADLSAEEATVAVVRGTPQELDLELRDHRRFAQERGPVDGIVGRDAQVRSIRDYLQADTNRPLIVFGPSGSGKTALLAYVAQQPFLPGAEVGGVSPLILTRFIGAHPESSTLRALMTSLCRELRVHLPIAEPLPDTLQKLIEEFYAQLRRATAEQPIYVFLDALDQLEATDQARECLWLRAQILPQVGEAPCHARIVASCLSPSEEFPLESDACEPFRRLQSRGLLADEVLGALGETAAGLLLRRWLADQQRDLTQDQWQAVNAALHNSSACRQPLYLRALHEQLRGWRAFDTPTPFPASLSLLIHETLTQLSQPNQHGPLPRLALGYLVSSRYGLSEGELLEILFRDPEMQEELETAGKAYGHHLPSGANRFPVAPWARLRSDLRAYLSERAAPGTTVLSCYHRQVEQAVRTLFLDVDTLKRLRLQIADYFEHQPVSVRVCGELPWLLREVGNLNRLKECVASIHVLLTLSESSAVPWQWELLSYWIPLRSVFNARETYCESLAKWEATRRTNDEILAAVTGVAMFHHISGDWNAAIPLLKRSLEIAEATYGTSHPAVAERFNRLATAFFNIHKLAMAEPLYRRALEITMSHSGPDSPTIASQANDLAILLVKLGRREEARTLMLRSLAIDEKAFGPNHPNVARDLVNLGPLSRGPEEHESLLRRALEIDERNFGTEHPEVAQDLSHLGMALQRMHRHREAEAACRRAIEIALKTCGPDHHMVVNDRIDLAELLVANDQLEKATGEYRLALLSIERGSNPNDAKIFPLLSTYSIALLRLYCRTRAGTIGAVQTPPASPGSEKDKGTHPFPDPQSGPLLLAECRKSMCRAMRIFPRVRPKSWGLFWIYLYTAICYAFLPLIVGLGVWQGRRRGSANILTRAARDGDIESLQSGISVLPSIDAPLTPEGANALFVAAHSGQKAVVEFLLESGANVNALKSDDNTTALHAAAQEGHLEIVESLVKAGADVNRPNSDGCSPLWMAAVDGHADIVSFLIESGSDPNTKRRSDGASALFMAADNDFRAVLRSLICANANVNAQRFSDGATALVVAIQGGHHALVAELIEAGASVSLSMHDGTSPVFIAAQQGHVEILNLLVARGADVNLAKRPSGAIPLMIAVQKDYFEIAQALVAAGANVNARISAPGYSGGVPVLALAQAPRMRELLTEAGAKADPRA